jgi:hypothetical protein
MLTLNPRAVEWRLVEGEVMALDVQRREYFAVNDSGATLWSLLAEGTTERRLVDALVDRYEISTVSAAEAVDGFLSSLDERGLITRP